MGDAEEGSRNFHVLDCRSYKRQKYKNKKVTRKPLSFFLRPARRELDRDNTARLQFLAVEITQVVLTTMLPSSC